LVNFSKAKRFFANPAKTAPSPAGQGSLGKAYESFVTQGSLDGGPEWDSSSSVPRAMTGAVGALADYYFPPDLIGGCCPRIVGEEQEIVWNAAAEAADTERVLVVWQARGDKIWYVAVRASQLSSHPNTWCPFSSLLPGMADALDPPVIYTYYSDEAATMMVLLPDGLQIYRGTSSVIRAKAERASRELGDAGIVDLIPDRIQKLTPMPWFSLSLFEERARRVLATFSVLGAVTMAAVALMVWFLAAMVSISARIDAATVMERSEARSAELLRLAQNQRASPMREQLGRFADVNDGLLNLNGYLEIYLIEGNRARWRAIVPASTTSDRIKDLEGQTLGTTDLGVIIGSDKDATQLGRTQRRER